jgi:hypothetical protein
LQLILCLLITFSAKVRLKEKPSPTHGGKDGDDDDDVTALLDGDFKEVVEALNTDDKEAQ